MRGLWLKGVKVTSQVVQLLERRAGIHISLGRLLFQSEEGDHTHGATVGRGCNQQRGGADYTSMLQFILCHVLPARLFLVSMSTRAF